MWCRSQRGHGTGRGNPLHPVLSFSLIRHFRNEKGTGPKKLSQRLLVLFLGTGDKWPIAVQRLPSNGTNGSNSFPFPKRQIRTLLISTSTLPNLPLFSKSNGDYTQAVLKPGFHYRISITIRTYTLAKWHI